MLAGLGKVADLYTFGFLAAKITVQMQVAHVIAKEYHPNRADTLLLTAHWVASLLLRPLCPCLGWGMAVLTGAELLRFFVTLARRIAGLLRINILLYTPKD